MGKLTKAMQIVHDTLTAVLPEGVPPSFQSIISAEVIGAGRSQSVVGELAMFDGLPATVRLSRWAFGWSHQYIDLPGGALSFENGEWIRIGDDGEPVLPLFITPTGHKALQEQSQ